MGKKFVPFSGRLAHHKTKGVKNQDNGDLLLRAWLLEFGGALRKLDISGISGSVTFEGGRSVAGVQDPS